MREKPCAAVIHFAAYIAVGESMKVPEVYFRNNVAGSLSLLTAMIETGIKNIVFSSTAAVYGMPSSVPIAGIGAILGGQRLQLIEDHGGEIPALVR